MNYYTDLLTSFLAGLLVGVEIQYRRMKRRQRDNG